MRVLIIGGAGYIGSHVCRSVSRGFETGAYRKYRNPQELL